MQRSNSVGVRGATAFGWDVISGDSWRRPGGAGSGAHFFHFLDRLVSERHGARARSLCVYIYLFPSGIFSHTLSLSLSLSPRMYTKTHTHTRRTLVRLLGNTADDTCMLNSSRLGSGTLRVPPSLQSSAIAVLPQAAEPAPVIMLSSVVSDLKFKSHELFFDLARTTDNGSESAQSHRRGQGRAPPAAIYLLFFCFEKSCSVIMLQHDSAIAANP
jgi:hypothetical protein